MSNAVERSMARGYVVITIGDETRRVKNRLTDAWPAMAAKLFVGDYTLIPSRIVLGVGTPPPPLTGPLATDTALWNENAATRRSLDVRGTFLSTIAEYGVTYDTSEFNDIDFREAGLEDDDGTLLAHVYFDPPVKKTSAAPQTMSIRWEVEVLGN